METFMQNLRFGSRDHGRTPMQWDASEHAGFTSGNPWLPLNPNYIDVNTEAELADENSVFNHFKKMTALRKESEVLIYGDYALLLPEHPQVYAYTRSLGDEQFLVMLNFSKEKVSVILEELGNFSELKINNYSNLNKKANELQLEPYQAVILAKS